LAWLLKFQNSNKFQITIANEKNDFETNYKGQISIIQLAKLF
jgi:hypothetical protein